MRLSDEQLARDFQSTNTDQVSYATRRKLQEAGVPFDLIWDRQGLYLAHWFEHRMAGKTTSVGAACEASGISPDAVRQRRKHNPAFAAAEMWARRGVPFEPPGEPANQPQDVVPAAPGKPLSEHPPGDPYWLPPVIPSTKKKERPSRRAGVPMWCGGTGYERLA